MPNIIAAPPPSTFGVGTVLTTRAASKTENSKIPAFKANEGRLGNPPDFMSATLVLRRPFVEWISAITILKPSVGANHIAGRRGRRFWVHN